MKYKKLFYIALLIVTVLVIIIVFGISNVLSVIQPKTKSEIVAIVDRGQVVSAVEAAGVVEAENEVIILSPASSIIKKINKEAGSSVRKGEVILELDKEQVQHEIEDITDQLEVKRNTLDKSRLNNRSTLIDLEYNVEVKKLKITSLQSQLADEEELLTVGGISPARVEETKQNIVLAEKDLAMVLEKNDIRLKQMNADEQGLLFQIKIQEKQLSEKKLLLEKLEVKAPSDGILLSVSGRVGEKVNADRMLVTMSDLTTFKINGTIDEKYSEFIKTGNHVYAVVDKENLGGRIGNITPVIENNKIQFYVHLDVSNHPGLIANQAIRLQVVRSLKDNTLRIPSCDEFLPGHEQIVLVKDSERVVRKNVLFGIKGYEYQEVVSGLEEGDKVITSNIGNLFNDNIKTSH